jgi:hypothetical protein
MPLIKLQDQFQKDHSEYFGGVNSTSIKNIKLREVMLVDSTQILFSKVFSHRNSISEGIIWPAIVEEATKLNSCYDPHSDLSSNVCFKIE